MCIHVFMQSTCKYMYVIHITGYAVQRVSVTYLHLMENSPWPCQIKFSMWRWHPITLVKMSYFRLHIMNLYVVYTEGRLGMTILTCGLVPPKFFIKCTQCFHPVPTKVIITMIAWTVPSDTLTHGSEIIGSWQFVIGDL